MNIEDQKEESAVIRVKDLYKIYRVGETKVRALNGVSFEIPKGEFVAIVGTSGSGKSTLLNMLAGLEKPTKGEILIGNVHIEKLTEKQLVAFRREKVGFIFQSYNLLNTMNAIENVALPLAFRGVPKKERLKEAREYMELVGVGKQEKHMLETTVFTVVEQMPEFSEGGQKALLAFIADNIPENIPREGRATVSFTVEKDGSLSDIRVIRSSSYKELDDEAIRIIRKMPKWIPGKYRGKAVRVKYTIPVTFRKKQASNG